MVDATPPSALAMEKTRAKALKELRGLLSEVLSTAVSSDEVPGAFKNVSNWERLIAQTETRFAEAWRQRFATGLQRREEHRALDLLPEEEQDQQVLSERFVNEVMDENREPLDDLDHQLAAMSGVQPDETRENPLGPSAWAAGIRSGVRELDCSADDRDWLMERIMPLLSDRVGQFYSAMSKQLASAGFAGKRRSRSPTGHAEAPVRDSELAAAATVGYSPELVDFRQDSAVGDDLDGIVALDHLLGLLSAQRAPAPGNFAGDGSQSPARGTAPAWTQADISSILGLLQKNYAGNPGAAEGASPVGNLEQAIGNTASQIGLAGGIQSMPGPAQDTLALVSMLFEVLLEGRRLDEKSRLQLSRLIIPYIRVAMLDKRLFLQSTHPARRVLNLLVEAFETAGPDLPQYKALRESAFQAIERIVVEFSDELELFDGIEQSLSEEIESCRARAELAERRAAEAQNGRERRDHARDSVAAYLSTALSGKLVPAVLLEFLIGPWQHHQNLTLLNEGDQSTEVGANQQLLQDLLDASSQGTMTAPGQLLPRILEVLQSSGQSAEAAAELVQQLSAAFATAARVPAIVNSVAQPATNAPAHVAPARATGEFLPPSVAAGPPPPVDLVSKYTEAPIGTWLDLVGEDGRVNSAKISWTSPISGRRILSNRRGQRILVASAEELAAMEIDGRIRPRHSNSAFDHALRTVTSRLETAAVRAS